MKTKRNNILARLTGITVCLVLAAGVAGETKAQVKGATRLLELSGYSVTARPDTGDYKPMACSKCKDAWVTVPFSEAKGGQALVAGGAPTKAVARHLCPGCNTTITSVGNSKATRHDVAIHKCGSCGAESLACCSTTKGSETATKGMEKKFEVAPLK